MAISVIRQCPLYAHKYTYMLILKGNTARPCMSCQASGASYLLQVTGQIAPGTITFQVVELCHPSCLSKAYSFLHYAAMRVLEVESSIWFLGSLLFLAVILEVARCQHSDTW